MGIEYYINGIDRDRMSQDGMVRNGVVQDGETRDRMCWDGVVKDGTASLKHSRFKNIKDIQCITWLEEKIHLICPIKKYYRQHNASRNA